LSGAHVAKTDEHHVQDFPTSSFVLGSPRQNPEHGVHLPPWAGRKNFFLKKEAKTLARLSRIIRRQPRKVFWFFFSKKNCFLT
jgi:hypothetical protein